MPKSEQVPGISFFLLHAFVAVVRCMPLVPMDVFQPLFGGKYGIAPGGDGSEVEEANVRSGHQGYRTLRGGFAEADIKCKALFPSEADVVIGSDLEMPDMLVKASAG